MLLLFKYIAFYKVINSLEFENVPIFKGNQRSFCKATMVPEFELEPLRKREFELFDCDLKADCLKSIVSAFDKFPLEYMVSMASFDGIYATMFINCTTPKYYDIPSDEYEVFQKKFELSVLGQVVLSVFSSNFS
ncbi:hypothetical protein HMI55_006605 [Coelomomyces lativittatus]|nr:hypothetical protein HMI55_006605 [Coelomomyces lativittatus]KAJ1512587.1 hypothetical protein HMI56_003856 [Coelomomyces lativittatus]